VVFRDGQSNCHSDLPGLSLVAMATKFGTKWAITRLLLEISARSLHLQGGFGIGPSRTLHLWGFFGVGPSNSANKILLNIPLLPWQWNSRQKSFNLDSVKDISEIFASNGRFWGMGFEWGQSNSTTTDPCCHLNVTWPKMVKIVIVKYLWPDVSVTDQL